MTTMRTEALDALKAKQEAEQKLASIALCPPWRHAAFAGVEAALVASPAVVLPLRFALLVLALAGVALIVRSDKRRLGMFINGYRRGKTRMVVIPLLILLLGIYSLSCYFGIVLGRPMVSVALAAVAFAVAYAGSVQWQRVFVRELGA